MADITYTIQLSNDQTVTIDQNLVQLYPTIANQLGDLAPGNNIVLAYDDPAALYTVLSTDYLHTGHSLETYVRLVKAVDYLGNDKLLDKTLKTIIQWFDTSDVLSVLKQNKDEVKRLMKSLRDTEQWRMLELYTPVRPVYSFDGENTNYINLEYIVSDNLDYIFIIPTEHIFNKGLEVYRAKERMIGQYGSQYGSIVITNDENIYIVELVSDMHQSAIERYKSFVGE